MINSMPTANEACLLHLDDFREIVSGIPKDQFPPEEPTKDVEVVALVEVQAPSSPRTVITLQLIRGLPGDADSLFNRCEEELQFLSAFVSAYFSGMQVCRLDPSDLVLDQCSTRTADDTEKVQVLCADVFSLLKSSNPLGDGTLCAVCLVDFDLYPASNWNFVFGIADPPHKTVLISLARMTQLINPASISWIRCCKVVVHEICHILGLQHCTYYRCRMNQSAQAKDTDESPLFLCPLCERQLQWTLQCDLVSRYTALQKVLQGKNACAALFKPELRWITFRLYKISMLLNHTVVTTIDSPARPLRASPPPRDPP